MTDVTVAPEGGAPSAAPSNSPISTPSNEAVVDQNPVQTPNPVGSQAPDKPPPSRREAIQAAFDRATKQQDAGTARKPPANRVPEPRAAAEAKPGHNRPPEQTPPEKAAPAIPRGERGQFAPRQAVNPNQGPDPQQSLAGVQTNQPVARQIRELPGHAPYAQPPARLAEHAKADWADTPESVRGETHRMHNEFAKAYKFYKDGHEAFQPIKRFHEMAQQQGTTLEKALNNYTSIEAKLREDVVAGLDTIVNNLNLRSEDGQQLGLRDVCYHVLSQSPEQLRQMQQGNQQTAAANQIGALHQKMDRLENAMQQWQTAQQFTSTRSAVDQFAETHPRFDEIGDAVNQELKFGFDLETAYRRAALLQPATQAAQTRNPPAQTRTDRSISGAPDGGSMNGHADRTSRKNGQAAPSRREAIQNAIRRVNGGL